MRFLFALVILLCYNAVVLGQSKLDKTLKRFNSESVPYIYPKNISDTTTVILLDTRKKEEYDISHLKNAIWVGDKAFEANLVLEQILDKEKSIIVYCSIGVRSEDIGEKLLALGYKDVKNLYGGIFQWKNKNGAIYNNKEQPTDSVHAFSKHWGKLLLKGVKVY
ncbi:rhodanese-like domain-containing protein [Maribacter antarcticus]|uniref:rhodanese-like domain-containing protein n=1 Tax=Maribacter antarcticus TaxID=505250 RepID=UPI00047E07A9|nr:rhodanese-like domain-containing protein [Maribacter antarcticus]